MKLRCLVIDDEKHAREGIAQYVQRVASLELAGQCKSAIEANEFLQKQAVDLLLLDIQMPDLTGIEWLESLSNPPKVIFTTAYREHALEGFELNAVDYLVKPISFQRFLKACNKVIQAVATPTPQSELSEDYIFIKVDNQIVKIFLKDILYIEAAGDYIFIYTLEQRFMTLLSLKQVEEDLADKAFIRVHRSFLVHKPYVDAIEGNLLKIREKKIPVSRNYYEKTYEAIVGEKLWKKNG